MGTGHILAACVVCLLACGSVGDPSELRGEGEHQSDMTSGGDGSRASDAEPVEGACETLGEVVTREPTAVGDTAVFRWSGGRAQIALVLVFHGYSRVRVELDTSIVEAGEDVCIPGDQVGGFVGFEAPGGAYTDMYRFVRVSLAEASMGSARQNEPLSMSLTLVLESVTDPSVQRTIVIPHVASRVEDPPLPPK